jgi:hypothetical protein
MQYSLNYWKIVVKQIISYYKHVRFQVLTATSMKFRVFWNVAPCSHAEVDQRFRGTALMMEAVLTSKTSVNFNLTIRRYIPEESKLYTTKTLDLDRETNCYFQNTKQEFILRRRSIQFAFTEVVWQSTNLTQMFLLEPNPWRIVLTFQLRTRQAVLVLLSDGAGRRKAECCQLWLTRFKCQSWAFSSAARPSIALPALRPTCSVRERGPKTHARSVSIQG